MKKSKVILSIICMILICSLSINVAFANELIKEDSYVMCGDSGSEKVITLDEQKEAIINNTKMLQAKKDKAIKKIEFIKDINSKSQFSILADYEHADVYTSVTCYKQINNYYCGPATTKQTMQYLVESSDSQQAIAAALGTTTSGTDGTRIVNYLNNHQTENYYIITTPTSAVHMAEATIECLATSFAIPIIRVTMSTSQGWPYNSSGHFMNISGQKSPTSGFKYVVTDPYIQYITPSNTYGTYEISINAVYNSTINHFAQHFYW